MGLNTALAAEALIVLDLVNTVVLSMKVAGEVKIVINMDCRKMWDLLTSKKIKESQLVGVSGSIISKIKEFESKTKIELEYVHTKTKENDDDAIENKDLEMVLKCDKNRKKKEFSA